MAVIVRDHLSHEAGHTGGPTRLLLGVGLVSIVVGVLGFAAAVLWGLVSARDGSVAAADSVRMLAPAGAAVVVGTVLTAAGSMIGRRAAGE